MISAELSGQSQAIIRRRVNSKSFHLEDQATFLGKGSWLVILHDHHDRFFLHNLVAAL